jgi:peptidoglycan/LPS O-acetylase OafA/YrhL
MPTLFHLSRILLLLLISSVAFSIAPISASKIQRPHHFANGTHLLSKPAKLNRMVAIVYKLLRHKKSKSIAAIAFGFLAALLLAFIIFGAAYGGAAGGIIALIAIVGLGLIVFGIIKISKARKRKRSNI